jgi:hypothetical protein
MSIFISLQIQNKGMTRAGTERVMGDAEDREWRALSGVVKRIASFPTRWSTEIQDLEDPIATRASQGCKV